MRQQGTQVQGSNKRGSRPDASTTAESDPLDEVKLLIRELASAHAEVRFLRTQLYGNREHAGDEKARAIVRPLPETFLRFNDLPDDAFVDIRVVTLLENCSIATA